MKKLSAARRIRIGLFLIGTVAAMGAFGLFVHHQSPFEMNLPGSLAPSSATHPFGTDQNGRDVLARVIFGARISLSVAVGVVFGALVLGLLIGTLAAVLSPAISGAVVQGIDIVMAFPGFLLVLALVAVVGPGLSTLIFLMAVTSWAGTARLVRAELLKLQTHEFVQAAYSLGASKTRVVVVHLWPQLTGLLLTQASFLAAAAILTESSLSFLGLGVPANYPTWGSLLSVGRKFLIEAPQMSLFPGLALLTIVFGFNILGDGLRDYFDSRT